MNYTPEELKDALDTLYIMMASHAHIRKSDAEWSAINTAVEIIEDYAERQNPQPLTLSQLRQMDGLPVWVTEKHKETRCGIVDIGNKDIETKAKYYPFAELGKTYKAYAHQPKGAQS
jgi:hypothetical protein